MSGAFIEINLTGSEVFTLFNRIPQLAGNPSEMLDEVGAYLDSDVTERFTQGQTPEGASWLPSQRALAENGKTLIDKGLLRDSVTHNVEGNDLHHGVTEIYGAIHHFGGEAGRKSRRVNIPARPIIGIAARQQARIDKISIRWMTGWFK